MPERPSTEDVAVEASPLRDLAIAAIAPSLATAVAALLEPLLSESDVIMLYVAGVTTAAFRVRLSAGLIAAAASALAFNFFFIEPRHTLYVHDSRYWLTFILIASVGALVSTLAATARARAAAIFTREAQSRALFDLARRLSSCRSAQEAADAAVDQLHAALRAPVAVSIRAVGEPAITAARGAPGPDPGWSRLPLGQASRGELAVAPDAPASAELLPTTATLLGEVLERLETERAADAARLQAETERVRSTLLSSVSHDLRTPLATITGSATALLDPEARIDGDARRQLIARVADEARRLHRLLDNVLHMTRLDGALAPALEWELPEEIVAAVLDRAPGRDVRWRPPPRPMLARLDAALLAQLVTNLVDNALVHGGGPVEVTLREDGELYTLEVADRGPGLPAGDPARLFEKFVRGPTGTGSGLGLAICKAVAELHGGRAWARPRDGGGAVFGATLPRGGPRAEPIPSLDDIPTPEDAP